MNYFPFNNGDISVMTAGMNSLSFGVFMRLAVRYTSTEAPISEDWVRFVFRGEELEIAHRILGIYCERTLSDRSANADQNASECLWSWRYFDEIVGKYREKGAKARASAAVSAAVRREKASKNSDVQTQANAQRTLSERRANQEPRTNNQIEKKVIKKAVAFRPPELDSGLLDPRAFADWVTVRKAKRAPLTETAWDRLKAEAAKAGLGINEVVSKCAEKGWTSFCASWESAREIPVDPAAKAEADKARFERIYNDVFGGTR